jgi:purine-binding chemotaxis protein CheW
METMTIEGEFGRDLGDRSRNLPTKKGTPIQTEILQFVEFVLGTEYFAINLFNIKEVITSSDITPLPNSPVYIKGIMDLRGTITTIVDLRDLLNLTSQTKQKKRSRIIILDPKTTNKSVGVLVDDVYSVSTHQSSDIEHDDSSNSGKNILGVIRKNQNNSHKLIVWLDIEKICASIKNDL